MRQRAWTLALGVALLLGVAGRATGAGPQLALEIRAEKEVRVEGGAATETRLVAADVTSRDDIIVYAVTYSNKGDAPLRDPAVVDPVPVGTAYVDGSAGGAGATVTFSVDGGKTFGPAPVMRTVTRADGTTAPEPAPPESYTHIRWTISGTFVPGASGQVHFKVKVK
jgi:uncharacterized repeat protein (TIGR01451 family)